MYYAFITHIFLWCDPHFLITVLPIKMSRNTLVFECTHNLSHETTIGGATLCILATPQRTNVCIHLMLILSKVVMMYIV